MSWILKKALEKLKRNELDIPEYESLSTEEKEQIRMAIKTLSKVLAPACFESEDIELLFGKAETKKSEQWYLEHAPVFGERAWKFRGKLCDIILWDEGNGWYTVIAILLHSYSIYEWVKENI